MNWNRLVLVAACVLAGSAVVMGAYQAHGLAKHFEKLGVEPTDALKRIDNCGTAVRYQMWHGLALFGIGLLGVATKSRFYAAPILALLGVAAFSGGLYEIVFRGEATHWAIVPFGGMLLILSWTTLAVSLLTARLGDANATQ